MAKDTAPVQIVAPVEIELVDITKIDSSPHNIPGRATLDIDELAESIKVRGLMNPVTLVPANGRYKMVAGHRRLAAFKKLGATKIPATIRATESDADHAVDTLVENLQRADLSAMEEARMYAALQSLGMKQREIAKQVSRSQPHVNKRLALTDLPQEVQDAVDAGGININDAVTLVTELKDDPDSLLRVFHNRSRGSINFLIAGVKQAKERKAEAAGKPEPSEEDLQAQKDAASKRRLITKLVKKADEARFKALEVNAKGRTAKTKILDFTLQGLVEVAKLFDRPSFEAACVLLKVNRVDDPKGFGQIFDVTEYIKRNEEENWIRLANAIVLMRGHLALAGAKEPLTGPNLQFAAASLDFLQKFVGYKANQGEEYLLGLLDIGEVEPPAKEEKAKPEPKAKKGEAPAAQEVAVGALPFQPVLAEGTIQCPECQGTGVDPSDSEKQCQLCEGSGVVEAGETE